MKLNFIAGFLICVLFSACQPGSTSSGPRIYAISELDSVDAPKVKLSDKELIRFSIIEDSTLSRGYVLLRMIVNEDGSISHTGVERSLGKREDAIALAKAKKLPGFVPGRKGNETVKVLYYLPFVFNVYGPDTTRKE